MSYTVFALTWRPKSFDEIVGQPHITTQLVSAIQKDRLAHAFLFCGPRGVGKTSTARILAKSLNCRNGPTEKPCGTCPACLDIASGRSLDVIEIDGASNRGIDEIRTLRENVKFAPVSGAYKVYIIDEVHQITADGFNALLKTLEEPPKFVKFIFATTQPGKVPPTILSRCQRLDFRRISVMEIIGQLKRISAAEKVSVDTAVLTAVARASDGSLRDAESILDQLVAFAKGSITIDDVISMLGMVEQEVLFELSDAAIRRDPRLALTVVDRLIDRGKDPGVLLADLIGHFRNLMIARICRDDSRLIDLPQELCARLVEHADRMSMEDIFNGFSVLVNAQELSKRLESVRIPLEIAMVKLCRGLKPEQNSARPPAAQKTEEAVPRPKAVPEIKTAPHKHAPGQTRPPAMKPPQAAPQEPPGAPDGDVPPSGDPVPPVLKALPAVSLEAVTDAWQAIVGSIGKVKISVATYLREGVPTKVSGNILTVAFHKNHALHKETLERRENREMVEKHAGEALKTALRVLFVLTDTEKEEDTTINHPAVQSALDMFNARLVQEG